MRLKKQKTISKLSVSSVHQTGYWSQSNLTLTAHHLWLYFTFWLVWLMLPTQVALLFLCKYCKLSSEQLRGEGKHREKHQGEELQQSLLCTERILYTQTTRTLGPWGIWPCWVHIWWQMWTVECRAGRRDMVWGRSHQVVFHPAAAQIMP